MPLFDFRCRGCGRTFEALIRPQDTTAPRCPACNGDDLEKQLPIPAMTSPEKIQAAADKKRHKEAAVARRDNIAMDIEAEHHRLEDH
jgi:putative FmdB family regulatory protein